MFLSVIAQPCGGPSVEEFAIKNFTFNYPRQENPTLNRLDLSIKQGEFITICGKSGCGKSTLLRNLKPSLSPHGRIEGTILFQDKELKSLTKREEAQKIGFVLQNPESQIVTDKVWHELAFGLESLGYDTKTIRLRVAEMASFFGIQGWFRKDVSELSGGQKQLLNLASIMAMQPDVLILDEPTSQLDPIAAIDFLETIQKINREIGTTVLLTEHRLEEVLPMSDRAIVLENGEIIVDDTPKHVGQALAEQENHMFLAMPSAMQIYTGLHGCASDLNCPITVREGRQWITNELKGNQKSGLEIQDDLESIGSYKEKTISSQPLSTIEIKDVWFRYNKKEEDIIKDLSFQGRAGQIHCIVGGNGTGKSTALSLMSGMRKPYRGTIKILGKPMDRYTSRDLFLGILGVLPQDPQALFVEKTVELDLMEVLEGQSIEVSSKREKVVNMANLVGVSHLLSKHPYDLSGGEQQRAALAKVLLLEPKILLLDEPTKGIDPYFKRQLAKILIELKEKGITIIMVSHDIEFCAKYGDQCSMFFDGNIVTTNTPRAFFSGNSFYTTAANRMVRHIFPHAVTVKDVIELCKQNLQ